MKFFALLTCSMMILIQGTGAQSADPLKCHKNVNGMTKPWCSDYHRASKPSASYYMLTLYQKPKLKGALTCPSLASCCKPNFQPPEKLYPDEYTQVCKTTPQSPDEPNIN
ncbi:hypothetical protein PGT21_032919 [Puccinia graminis f. sp. tritici]|uniref:Secreted protein n=1 Tax=Puccinia graminis f. sp. tritici TaxID=56615 RepID=A0A5B0P9P6_PUCGR|nr:hypothetical protein PGT21_032919 [Puccinia graminis f. sp. tritici]KAA1132259.1 hypothetical protein PGTUg99_003157 [Puccinia graminis f. sp. tritici]